MPLPVNRQIRGEKEAGKGGERRGTRLNRYDREILLYRRGYACRAETHHSHECAQCRANTNEHEVSRLLRNNPIS